VAVSRKDCDDDLTASLVILDSNGRGKPRQIVKASALWPDLSPDGRHLVYTGPNSARDDTALWVSAPDGSDAHSLQLPGINSPSEPSWGPDSHRIAFVSPTGTYAHEQASLWNEDVYVTDVKAMNVERVTTTAGNDHWPPAWSPDGSTLVYSSDGVEAKQGDLMSIHIDTRNVTRLTDTDTNQVLADWRP
jgi:TolB protein